MIVTNEISIDDLGVILAEGHSRLYLVSLMTGQVRGTYPIGGYPMPVFRASRSELLVSDLERRRMTLTALDVRSPTLETKWSMPLPDRITYTILANGMILSRDEQYLYYLKHTPCEPGPWCDDYAVGVIDLDHQAEVANVPLPRNGGFAQLTQSGETNVAAMCPVVGELYEISPSGDVALKGFFPRHSLDDVGGKGYLAWPVYGGVIHNSHVFMIFEDGTIHVRDRTGNLIHEDELMPGTSARFNGVHRWHGKSQEVILGYEQPVGQEFDGLAGVIRVDPRQIGAVVRPLSIPPETTSLSPMAFDRTAIVHDGRVSVVDSGSSEPLAGPFSMPSGTEWVIGS